VLESYGKNPPIPSIAVAKGKISRRAQLRIDFLEPCTLQAKTLDESRDWWMDSLDSAQRHLLDRAIETLKTLETINLRYLLRSLSQSRTSHAIVKSAHSAVVADTERNLRNEFVEFVRQLSAVGKSEVETCVEHEFRSFRQIILSSLQRVTIMTTVGSPLRRREALLRSQHALSRTFRRLNRQKSSCEHGENTKKGGDS
jgi:hypothetical protein